MKKSSNLFALGIMIFAVIMIFISCKKENPEEETPVNTVPSIVFMTGPTYTSSNTVLEVNESFKVGVLAGKDPGNSINLATFKVTREFNDTIVVVYEENDIGESDYSWESTSEANPEFGEEKWTFAISDLSGGKKEISFIITTLTQGTLSPFIEFIVGAGYISDDVPLNSGSKFKVGLVASQNAETNENLHSFNIDRTFNNITTNVYEENNISGGNYMWEDSLTANILTGLERWDFTVTDMAGRTNTISFVISTENVPPYTPVFSPTYLIVNQGGIELLDIYITCVSDDWEMTKIIVTYPGGLGSETYLGIGQIITTGTPYTFINYFPKLTGTWAFAISGIIKSGDHLNENFTSICTVNVSEK